MTRITLLAAVATALLAIVASGCGSSGASSEGVADLDTGAAASADGSTTPQQSQEDSQEAALEWAKCMREHGVDVPDPQVDEDGRVEIRPGAGGARPDRDGAKFREAVEACGTPFGDAGPPQLSEEDRQELQESMLEFAQCMRDHGVDMPDPDFSGGGGTFRAGPGRGGVDPDDPTFREAQEACEPLLQGRGQLGVRGGNG